MHELKDYLARVNTGFAKNQRNGVVFFTVPAFEQTGLVRHGFTSRIGGVSTGCFESLNLSCKRENDPENILKNFRIAAEAIGVDAQSLVLCRYEHGINVEFADERHLGMGIWRENELPFCDGVAVTDAGITAVTIHADCNPIFFMDKKGRAAGVCHAGWRGTYGNVIGTIVKKFASKSIAPADILLGFGPSIGPCCFEVQEDVGGLFAEKFGETVRSFRQGRQYVDLWSVLALEAMEAGIPPENVTMSRLCTYCEKQLFYSHRRDAGKTGAMGSFIQLVK
ncbi:MAG: laccase domain-containing protein [Christensenellaceae bacterium]|nr:laccase domain-containing protein [Christensenellaceae bacterium]